MISHSSIIVLQVNLDRIKSEALATFVTLNARVQRDGLGVPVVLTDLDCFYMLHFSLDREGLIEFVKFDGHSASEVCAKANYTY